jgi:hypothetical protein
LSNKKFGIKRGCEKKNIYTKYFKMERKVRKAQLVRKEGTKAEFEREFLSKPDGRKMFLDTITEPSFVKAVNEFCSAFMPFHCADCEKEITRKYITMSKEERWVGVTDIEIDRTCYECGTEKEILYKNSMFCHLRLCKACFDK